MTFNSSRIVTAAKEHHCDECGRRIVVGEKHRYEAGVWEGDFYTRRDCNGCNAAYLYHWRTCEWVRDGEGCDMSEHLRELAHDGDVQAAQWLSYLQLRWTAADGSRLPIPAVEASA